MLFAAGVGFLDFGPLKEGTQMREPTKRDSCVALCHQAVHEGCWSSPRTVYSFSRGSDCESVG